MFDAKNMMAACDPRWRFCMRFCLLHPLEPQARTLSYCGGCVQRKDVHEGGVLEGSILLHSVDSTMLIVGGGRADAWNSEQEQFLLRGMVSMYLSYYDNPYRKIFCFLNSAFSRVFLIKCLGSPTTLRPLSATSLPEVSRCPPPSSGTIRPSKSCSKG